MWTKQDIRDIVIAMLIGAISSVALVVGVINWINP